MRGNTFYALLLGLAVTSGAGGFYFHQLTNNQDTTSPKSVEAVNLGDQRPTFSLPDLTGELQSIERWDGKILLINFWASWCPPCIREIPAFEAIYQDYRDDNLVVIGIAMDDVENIERFLSEVGVSYPIIHGQLEVSSLMRQLGNKVGALPYTVAIDSNGRFVAVAPHGELDYQQIESFITPFL